MYSPMEEINCGEGVFIEGSRHQRLRRPWQCSLLDSMGAAQARITLKPPGTKIVEGRA